jgi:hypothetical protein
MGDDCTLKDHVYTCNSAAFQRALLSAKTATVETQNVDGAARQQLTGLVVKKLGKTLAPEGGPTDLIFLIVPTEQGGTVDTRPGATDLGTLRVYSASADGTREHLLWAETYSGEPDMPWPAVVHSLIAQFEGQFHIK